MCIRDSNTRSQGVLTLPTNPPVAQNVPIEPNDEMDEAHDAAQLAEAAAASDNAAAAAAVPRQIKMDLYSRPVFEGRSTDDALSFLQYVERYTAFK